MNHKIFFDCLESLNNYSLELGKSITDVHCNYCQSHLDWVSHGFVYKKSYGGTLIATGKRVFCSNRGNQQGCGRTLQLYLAEIAPKLHYPVTVVFHFVSALMIMSMTQAYQQATGCQSTRNAYRWIDQLNYNIPRHRTQISMKSVLTTVRKTTSKRIKIIMETFVGLAYQFVDGKNYQIQTQQALIVS